MSKLWRERTDYKRFEPDSVDCIKEAGLYPDRFLPYERLYRDLTREELLELLRDAKRLGWRCLDLRNCGLDSLPEELCELNELCMLLLRTVFPKKTAGNAFGSENSFTRLPDSIGQLTNLRLLNLSYTKLAALPESIGELSELNTLYLGYSQITSLPGSVGKLRKLQVLYLQGTKLTELPETLCSLPELRELSLRNTKVRELPEAFGQLTSLKTLNLAGCRLRSIPYSLVQLGLPFATDSNYQKNCVNLSGAALEEGDLALFSKPRELIEAYYKNLGSEERSECKVIFLGDGAAGKSSIIERIVFNRFAEGSLPTDGVKMTKWTEYPDGSPLSLEGRRLTIRFMDFGGQEILHSIHRCFLTDHTVYVVVCESRDDAEIDVIAARWMETVRAFAPNSPVLLALNKADLNPNVTVNERRLREINTMYRHMIRTSAMRDNDPGIRQLTESIFRELPECISMVNANRDFLSLKNELETMQADYILPEEFSRRCEHFHIEPNLRGMLLSWFQDLGIAYTYTTTFRKVYVLNPTWLTNGIYRLILRTENGGFLRHSVIRETLGSSFPGDIQPDKTYSPQEMEFILHVMRRFEISMPILSEFDDGIEMIPMKMEKTPPARYDEFPKQGALHLRWETGYLPNNLVHRLMIRKYPELDPDMPLLEKCVWRTGGWFKSPDGEQQALVEMSDKALDLYVRGAHDARIYMDSFRQMILQLLHELNIQAKEYVYCSQNGEEGKVSYKAALNHYRMGKKEIYVEDLECFVSPQELLHENYLNAMEDRDFFISYNNGHDGGTARWIAETLREAGYTVHFQGDDCLPGMDFLSWMNDAITHSRGFIAVWSSAYEKSDYCQMELNAATVKRHQMRAYLLLPVRAEAVPVENALFKSLVYVSVYSEDREANREALLRAVKSLKR